MRLNTNLRRLCPCAVAILLMLHASAHAGPETPSVETTVHQLRFRLEAVECRGCSKVIANVGDPLRLSLRVENRGDKPVLLVPASHLQVRFEHGNPAEDPPWPGCPARIAEKKLVSLAPGATHEFTVAPVPRVSGAARLVLRYSAGSVSVTTLTRVVRGDDRARAVHYVSTPVDSENLWRGQVRIEVPVEVRLFRGLGSDREDSVEIRITKGGAILLDRLDAYSRWAERVADERSVVVMASHLAARPEAIAEFALVQHLLVALRRGYGAAAIGSLIEVAGDEARAVIVREAALHAAWVATSGKVVHESDEAVYSLPVTEEWRE